MSRCYSAGVSFFWSVESLVPLSTVHLLSALAGGSQQLILATRTTRRGDLLWDSVFARALLIGKKKARCEEHDPGQRQKGEKSLLDVKVNSRLTCRNWTRKHITAFSKAINIELHHNTDRGDVSMVRGAFKTSEASQSRSLLTLAGSEKLQP